MGENHKPKYTRQSFIEEIKKDASESCGVPVTVNDKRMEMLLRKAKRYFYQYYDGAVQESYLVVSKQAFGTNLFQERRMVQLPDCVKAIYQCQESDNYLFGHNPDPDYKSRKHFLGTALMGNSSDLVYSLTLTFYNDFVHQFDLRSVAFDYSENSNMLTILGRDPVGDLVLTVAEHVDETSLFRDHLFYNYVLGLAYKSIAKPLSVFDFKLIGGTTVNFSDIESEGNDLIQEVKDEIDDQINTADFFIVGDQTI